MNPNPIQSEKLMNKKTIFDKIIYKTNTFWINFAIILSALIVCEVGLLIAKSYVGMLVFLILFCIIAALYIVLVILRKKRTKKMAETLGIIDENGSVCSGLLGGFQLPAFVITEGCRLVWANAEFKKCCEEIEKKPGNVAGGIFKKHIENVVSLEKSEFDETIQLGSHEYKLYATYVSMHDEDEIDDQATILAYLVDQSGVEKLKKLYKERKIVLGEIIIDNYDEILQTNGESVANQVLVEINNIFDEWLKDKNAIAQRLVRERYIFICEMDSLKRMEREHFAVLEKAKAISVGNTIPVTLSIGVSTNAGNLTNAAFEALITGNTNSEDYLNAFTDTLAHHQETADELISLCLSRGGDQAIVRNSAKPNDNLFFGGSEIDKPREDMVKVRVTAELLKKYISESGNVIIMGHKFADLDALGSALAMYKIAKKLDKPSYIILEGSNAQIDVAYKSMMSTGKYEGVFIKKSEALNIMSDKTLVIVVDTFSRGQCEAPEVIDAATRICVVDHHRRGFDFIKETAFNYTEVLASSTSELLIEMLWYIFPGENILSKVEAEILYGGILVDTKNLYFKTGKRTFEVCGYLRDLGVVPLDIRKYVQPDYKDYLEINNIVAKMKVINIEYKGRSRGFAFADCEMSADEANKLASIAADKMLEFNGIECSFVLVQIGNNVAIKARSPGDVNVQTIMEHPSISGGGHLTAAAGVIKNISTDEAKSLIIKIINDSNKGAK